MKHTRDFNKLKILICSHVYSPSLGVTPHGHVGALIDFLKERVEEFALITHPFDYSEFLDSIMYLYKGDKSKVLLRFPGSNVSDVVLFLRDIVATFFFSLKSGMKIHVFIGVDSLNALTGVFLRKIGLIQTVVFYVIDYTPRRFPNPIKNTLYQSLCKVSARSSDFIWNLSPRMAKVWEGYGVKKEKNLIVPGGTYCKKLRRVPIKSINRRNLVFMGHLNYLKGPQLAIEALPNVIKRIPDVKLTIIGTGPLESDLKKMVKEHQLNDRVEFLGFIPEYSRVLQLLSKCAVGIATYLPDPRSYSFYADPGKVKEYLSCGLPVIITKVPEIAFEIEENGAGLVVNYDRDELVEAVVKLLTDEELFINCRKNAIKLATKYDWENIFDEAFRQMFLTRTLCEGDEK